MSGIRFEFAPQSSGTELRLMGPHGPVPFDQWAVLGPANLLTAIDRVSDLIANDLAIADEALVLIEDRAVARLSSSEAKVLGFGPPTDAVAHVAFTGILGRPGFSAQLEWRNALGRPLIGAERIGAWLVTGSERRRLPEALFEAASAVDAIATATDETEKMRAAEAFVSYRNDAAEAGGLRASGLANSVTIRVANSFTVDLVGDGPQARLRPELMRGGEGEGTIGLDASAQAAFADQFDRFANARPVYALPGNEFVVLEPAVRRGLDVVRRLQDRTSVAKREFMRAPRRFLREALGDEDEALLERIFVETEHYSERVQGLGLWTKRKLPWDVSSGIDWFGEDGSAIDISAAADNTTRTEPSRTPEPETEQPAKQPTGIRANGRFIPVEPSQALELREQLLDALAAARPHIEHPVEGEVHKIPADYPTLAELEALASQNDGDQIAGPGAPSDRKSRQVLIVASNEEEIDHAAQFRVRPLAQAKPEELLRTTLKAHQVEGLSWLQKAWAVGNPGVLLADDMGLGKTLQALAFLAWLRAGMASGSIVKQPLLVVAPTGLLHNWKAEHDRHLGSHGLGELTEAFGAGLKQLKRHDDEGVPRLDVERLAASDWVMTTYETLRDYQTEFGRVMFATILFDEAQKVKTPTVQMTDAAKAMKAQFKVAMTGTPIENRLAELWCITDLVHDACLGSLKEFRQRYENGTSEAINSLKVQLEIDTPRVARIMLRRTKRDHLPDLPQLAEEPLPILMPPSQQAAYDAARASARASQEPGRALQALQSLQRISLHPDPNMEGDDQAFIQASARLIGLMQVLDRAHTQGRKALVFVDAREMQARIGPLLQRRYRLPKAPLLINGEVSGSTRQARVDAFQSAGSGFDVMLISSRAGGVGLTLTAASVIVHLTRWWNPAVEDQCNGRALRIGQTREVNVFPLIARHPTDVRSFDENLHELLSRKRKLMSEALAAPEPSDAEKQWIFDSTLGGNELASSASYWT